MNDKFHATARSQIIRRPDRVSYDKEAVYAILDASLLCHIAYVIDGEPYVTPTAFWRDGGTLYWHGSKNNRMIAQTTAGRACITVSHLDGLIVGRSGKGTSVQYRSVMAFGRPVAITEAASKQTAMESFINRLYPGRTGDIRPPLESELAEITVVKMDIEEASAKVKTNGVMEMRDEDYDIPTWAGVIPVCTMLETPIPDDQLKPGTAYPDSLALYQDGVRLDDALKSAQSKN